MDNDDEGTNWPLWGFGLLGAAILIATMIWGEHERFPAGLRNPVTMLSGTILGIAILVLTLLIWSTWEAIRAKTPTVHTQDGWRKGFNPYDEVYIAGLWRILRLNGVFVPEMMITTSGKRGVLIAPADALDTWRHTVLVKAKREVWDLEELPPEVQLVIRDHKLKPPYIVATSPVAVDTRGHDVNRQWREVRLANKESGFYQEGMRRVMDASDALSRHLAAQASDAGRGRLNAAWQAFRRKSPQGDSGDGGQNE